MSAQPEEDRVPAIELPHQGDLAFGALMDALVPEEAGTPAGGDAQPAGAPAGGPAKGDVRTPAAGTDTSSTSPAETGQPAAGEAQPADGSPVGDSQQPATDSGAADLPGDWTVDAATVVPQLGTLSTTIEENLSKAYQTEAYTAARTEYEKYFEALEKHPRLLVGTQVPAVGREGQETLRDSNDAKEWQEAVKQVLVEEIKERAQVRMEESKTILETVHASIDLFKNNVDLIPGTKGFNRQLADSFAKMAKPYEVRADGKLQGYSIPVQPIIDSLRQQQVAAAPAAPAPTAAAAPPADPPQAGIKSKAASSGEKEDFSTLFGTIGLPHLQI
jgi:hypothetical protein